MHLIDDTSITRARCSTQCYPRPTMVAHSFHMMHRKGSLLQLYRKPQTECIARITSVMQPTRDFSFAARSVCRTVTTSSDSVSSRRLPATGYLQLSLGTQRAYPRYLCCNARATVARNGVVWMARRRTCLATWPGGRIVVTTRRNNFIRSVQISRRICANGSNLLKDQR